MKVIQKVKIKLQDKVIKYVKFLGFSIVKYSKDIETKKYTLFELFPANTSKINVGKKMFYLKVNSCSYLSLRCIQYWIDIIYALNADFHFVCDNDVLKSHILRNIKFYDENIKFIKSVRIKKYKDILDNIATKNWMKAGFAHLTTFINAKQNNIKEFWNIDADDTLFLLNPDKVAKLLECAESYANKNNLKIFSLDMHETETSGKHWSFGITYTKDPMYWLDIIVQNTDKNWQYEYTKYTSSFNLDWFFTYLRDTGYKDYISTFYFDNLKFAHLGFMHTIYIAFTITHWISGNMYFPLLLEQKDSMSKKSLPISENCVKLIPDFELCEDDYVEFITQKGRDYKGDKSIFIKTYNSLCTVEKERVV